MSIKNIVKKIVPNSFQKLLWKLWFDLKTNCYRFGKVNKNPIIIYGNQKSGTTAIAVLLARLSNRSITPDFFFRVPGYERRYIEKGLAISDMISRFKCFFGRDIIKEPGLSLLYDDVQEYFGDPKSLYIVRDPISNIRSILNRLKLRGDIGVYDSEVESVISKVGNDEWRLLLQGFDDHVIKSLALRCNRCLEIAIEAEKKGTLVVRYEDFLEDKLSFIQDVAQKLELPEVKDIGHLLDVQYQPKSVITDNEAFFSSENVAVINAICYDAMQHFDYHTNKSSV